MGRFREAVAAYRQRRWERKTIKRLATLMKCPGCGQQTTIIGIWGHALLADDDECEWIASTSDTRRLELLVMMLALNIPMSPELILKVVSSFDVEDKEWDKDVKMVVGLIAAGASEMLGKGQEPQEATDETPHHQAWKTWDDDDSETTT